MKRIIAIAAPALLLLAACDGDLEQNSQATTEHAVTSTSTSTTRQAAPPAKPAMTEDERIDMILQAVAADEGIHMTDGMAVEYATIICEGLDDGLSLTMLVRIGVDALPLWDAGQHSFLIGASVGAKCPEHSGMFGHGGSFA